MYFIVTLGVGVGAVGQPKLGTLGLNWVYTGCTAHCMAAWALI